MKGIKFIFSLILMISLIILTYYFKNMFLLNDLAKFIDQNIYPDLTIYIDLPVEESLKRLAKRNITDAFNKRDRFDNKNRDFFEKVREGYVKNINPRFRNRIVEFDGLKNIGDLQKEIQQLIAFKYKLKLMD